MDSRQFSAVILGATGAVGRELVDNLLKSPRWKEVNVIVRRRIARWDALEKENPELFKRLKIIQADNLDSLEKTDQWTFENCDSFFCCLGSRSNLGDDLFFKVDYKYPLWGGYIALRNKIPHYSLVTAASADSSSMFLYKRTKGQIEEALQKLNMPSLSIFRPGFLNDRDNDTRIVEKIFKYVPFVPKIDPPHLADALRRDAERVLDNGVPTTPVTITYENSQIKDTFPQSRS
eukprot:TRINITY_DN5629_c0_g1_i1.p1 TRINITY_DN5629_c0_g1~~TRINITY_DN5629_c0_g1_i1.p1  ORF type:complete len:233 (+),score=63.93 TRINITY_DN5629_c0_g1_i1:155-853(+)